MKNLDNILYISYNSLEEPLSKSQVLSYLKDLEKYGFDIIRVGNTSQQNFEKSVIYDLTYGGKIQALTILKNKTNANVALGMPQWLIDDLAKEISKETKPIQPDFILVLGRDADKTQSGVENAAQ